MPDFVYRGRVSEVLNSKRFVILLDLGFRVQTPRTFHLPDSQDHYCIGSEVIALVSGDDTGRWMGELLPGDDPDGLAMLWHYPARLIKVVDGDTIDARVDLGCGATNARIRAEWLPGTTSSSGSASAEAPCASIRPGVASGAGGSRGFV